MVVNIDLKVNLFQLTFHQLVKDSIQTIQFTSFLFTAFSIIITTEIRIASFAYPIPFFIVTSFIWITSLPTQSACPLITLIFTILRIVV